MTVTISTINKIIKYYAMVEVRDTLDRLAFKNKRTIMLLLNEAILEKRKEWDDTEDTSGTDHR